MKFTEGAFKQWGYDVAHNEFADKVFTWQQYDEIVEKMVKDAANQAQEKAEQDGKIIIKDSIADIFLQQILTRPAEHDVVATMNLNGDYISDALAAQIEAVELHLVQTLTMSQDTLFSEATHGTAPKYAGLNKVNPSSELLSSVLNVRTFRLAEAADKITDAIEATILLKL